MSRARKRQPSGPDAPTMPGESSVRELQALQTAEEQLGFISGLKIALPTKAPRLPRLLRRDVGLGAAVVELREEL